MPLQGTLAGTDQISGAITFMNPLVWDKRWNESMRLQWLVRFWLVVSILLLLRLPFDARDPLFIVVVVLACVISLKHFAYVWVSFIFILPFIHMGQTVFGQPKLDLLRIFLVGMAFVLIIRRDPNMHWRDLRKSPTFVGFVLFIMANIISAVFAFQLEALFRAVVNVIPLLFFVISYVVVRENTGVLRDVLEAIVSGGIIVGLIGMIEFAMQRSFVVWLGIPWIYDLEDRKSVV